MMAASDVAGNTQMYAIIAALVAIGVVLIAVGFWARRATRPDHQVLAPLEVMNTRAWRTSSDSERERLLDDVRPEAPAPDDSNRSDAEPDAPADADVAPAEGGEPKAATVPVSSVTDVATDGYGTDMATLDTDAMLQRFRDRAQAVKQRPLPPVAGEERQEFIAQAKLDFQDFAIIGDAEATIEDGVLVLRVDLRGEGAAAT